MAFGISRLEDLYDRIDAEKNTLMGDADGYLWGLDYLDDVIKQLEKLEQKAIQGGDPLFHNNIMMSIQRAREAKSELEQKLKSVKEPST